MIKRITITIAATALFAVPAQSASAALDFERPNAQEMEHGVQQPSYGGTTTPSSETNEPEATESIPTPAEQGVSTSPGVAPEVTDPSVPETPEAQQDKQEEDEGEEGDDCELNQELEQEARQLAFVAVFLMEEFPGTRVGEFGSELLDGIQGRLDVIQYDNEQSGCEEGETAQ